MSSLTKWKNRLVTIALGVASRLLSSFSNFIISIVVVRTQSVTLWGELIPYLILIDFGFAIVSWGSTPYLIREFSLYPNSTKTRWNESLYSRSLLLVLLLIFLLTLPLPLSIKAWLMTLSVFRFFSQSFEPIAQTERHFSFTLLIEILSIGIVTIPMLILKKFGLTQLLMLISLAIMVKAIFLLFFYKRIISLPRFRIQFFVDSFSFLLISISAMLQQRIDLFVATFFLSKKDIAIYQVFLNFLLLSLLGLSLVLNPYIKNIYRLKLESLLRLEKKYMIVGMILSALSVFFIYIALHYFYKFEINGPTYILGYFYISSYSFYAFRIHEINRLNGQMTISKYLFLSGLVSLIASVLLIPQYAVNGALMSGLFGQIFLVIIYRQQKLKGMRIVLPAKTTAAA